MIRQIPRKDLLDLLPSRFRESALQICQVFQEGEKEAFLVGGVVRDLLLGRKIGDLDIATSATPAWVQKHFPRVVPTGIQHGTVTVLYGKSNPPLPVEVTTYRTESTYTDGRHPDRVEYSESLEEDLKRRDFTINALAFDPLTGFLVDAHGGLEDLESRVIRTIGKAEERFSEDGLRPVRACRFAATLNFEIDEETFQVMSWPEIHRKIATVALERFTEEIYKALKEPISFSRMIRPLYEAGILPLFFSADGGILPGAKGDGLDLADRSVDASPEFRIAAWWLDPLKDRGLPEALDRIEKTGRHLRLSTQKIRSILFHYELIRESMTRGSEREDAELRKLLSRAGKRLGKELVPVLEGLPGKASNTIERERILGLARTGPLFPSDLVLNGRDLQQLGLRGIEIGRVLDRLLKEVLEDPSRNEKEYLLNRIPFLQSGSEAPG